MEYHEKCHVVSELVDRKFVSEQFPTLYRDGNKENVF